ncbi:hypothetical protein PC121_g19669 [Phytophthora cactorum]|nr:hypothetical protein PC121_g19669 [Phytophthora cactorum]KAG4044571.1 hypothetical protein PC123_g20004 [Phytophthora cactorum]
MRLSSTLVIVAATIAFASCEGAPIINEHDRFSPVKISPVNYAPTTSDGNRFLRAHEETSDRDKSKEGDADEERHLSKLKRTFSEKLPTEAIAKLTRSKSLVDLSKLDDAAYLRAIDGNNNVLFKRIEDMGFNPETMLKKMIDHQGHSDDLLLKDFSKYWVQKYPDWKPKTS